MSRAYNFSAGPAVLPEEVLAEAQAELLDYHGSGASIMEVSHRGKDYDAVHQEAIANITQLLGIPDTYAVLFLQGGATGQFGMVPMNLMGDGEAADYTHSGSWAGKAIKEAQVWGQVKIAADTSKETPARMPAAKELRLADDAAYVHITSNETISGVQWKSFPKTPTPLVADMSSDVLSRPIDISAFGLIYAGAQKNLGPAGVTLVVIRRDLAERASGRVPLIFRYKTHIEANSLYNTPPTFSVYLVALVTRWLLKQGGVGGINRANQAKAARLYEVIDGSLLLPRHRGCRPSFGDERHVPSAVGRPGGGVRKAGDRTTSAGPQGASLRGRYPGLDLQRVPGGGRRSPRGPHEGL